MNDTELLEKVKEGLSIYGSALDNTLLIYINEVKDYALNAGVPSKFFELERSAGLITIGVDDLYNRHSFSEYFNYRINQLKYWEG